MNTSTRELPVGFGRKHGVDRVFHIKGWSADAGRVIDTYVSALNEAAAKAHAQARGLTSVIVKNVPAVGRAQREPADGTDGGATFPR